MRSSEPDATILESRENSAVLTQFWCPEKVCVNLRFSTSHILTILSSPADTSKEPSELNAIDFTGGRVSFHNGAGG